MGYTCGDTFPLLWLHMLAAAAIGTEEAVAAERWARWKSGGGGICRKGETKPRAGKMRHLQPRSEEKQVKAV